ncbi:4'-phosphopantetheinyl transferase superfamily protein [Streptantibioticus ferralitis]|uniref:4'-phosphopantetheinyl transferase superfamily protein n=1 Tax=Streptantibioticus ferralitis TaxID=236510 RepID=A0ABT5Z9D0_9ACTN|nr:4'-phosphopantetheinyl transferase superfamily protein [Streptantibioticus ferralitis]MDF2260444.1 4'-phosphopantetheinyl transferase superfamily protein [Streptantibioticus ferralitis]
MTAPPPGRAARTDGPRLAALFDPAVVLAMASTDETPFPDWALWIRTALPEEALPARQRTFAAGRLAAARAITAATGRTHWLDADSRGAPLWPPGVSGSISHTGEFAVCVVTRARDTGLGIDVEPIASAPGLHTARRHICTPAEFEEAAGAEDSLTAVLRVFCAKEALYKALPAPLQEGLGFLSVPLRRSGTRGAPDTVAFRPMGGAPALSQAVIRTAVVGTTMAAAATLPRLGALGTDTYPEDGEFG